MRVPRIPLRDLAKEQAVVAHQVVGELKKMPFTIRWACASMVALLMAPDRVEAKHGNVSAALGIRLEAAHTEAANCAAKVGAVAEGARFIGSAAVMANFRVCMGLDADPGASDGTKMACAQKTGARYSYTAHRFTGPPPVIAAWQDCAGVDRDHGAKDPTLSYCATKNGLSFDYAVHHFVGSPERMRAFHTCTGLHP